MTTFQLVAPSGTILHTVEVVDLEDLTPHQQARSLFWAHRQRTYFPASGERPPQPCQFHQAEIREGSLE